MKPLQKVVLVIASLVPMAGLARDINTDLIKAAEKGDLKKVESSISKGADVNSKDGEGKTALMKAAYNGHISVVETLLAKGADVEAKGESYGWELPIKQKNVNATVQILLKYDADVNAFINYGMTMLSSRPGGGGKLSLYTSSATALMLAAIKGENEIVEALLNKGADVNAKDKGGYTPLMYALVVAGGNYSGMANQGKSTALMMAAGTGQNAVVKDLIAKGADVNAKNKEGYTSLMEAVLVASISNDFTGVQALLTAGADVNAKNNKGQTALALATANKNTNVIKLLKEAGAKE